MTKTVYVDNNATTRVDDQVIETMLPYLGEQYGNPSSMHSFGGNVGQALKQAREEVAFLINALPEEIIFTSCGTESDNTAILSTLNSFPEKKHVITTRVEHPAIKNLCENLAQNGYRITFVPVDNKGRLDLDYFYDHLSDDTALVSVMWANNESGVIFPIQEIAEKVSAKNILFHTDAVQAAGKIPIDVKNIKADLLSISGHKLHAPKGVAALYVRKGTRFTPFLMGGHQEGGRRGGTENVPSIIGFGRAAKLARENLADERKHLAYLRDRLENKIISNVPNAIINGDINNRLPGTSNISFEYVEGEAILLMLNEMGICASSGSACTSGSLEPSHVLRAMGVPYTAAHGSIRFSLSKYNTKEEIDYICEKIQPIIERLRDMSPFWHAK